LADGAEITLDYTSQDGNIRTTLNKEDDNRSFTIDGRATQFKCTSNGNIIFFIYEYDKIGYKNEVDIYNYKPYVQVIDIKGTNYKIDPYFECLNSSYKYRSVGWIGSNFVGEIYAILIYYNQPGQITGDEQIILYKWALQ
jgi:hypothetical protein